MQLRVADFRVYILIFIGVAFSPTVVGAADGAIEASTTQPSWDTFSDTWVATDGFGRTLPGFEECGPPKPNKTVGMFYYLWHDSARGEVRDNAKALLADPDAKSFGRKGEWHWWGEPLLGYYLVSDPFVQRTHAAMLSDAGIDAVICDVTNAFTYPEQYTALCKEYESIASRGQATPKIGFYHPFEDRQDRTNVV